MTPVYVVGRALASALGPSLEQALSTLRAGRGSTAASYHLGHHPSVPYQRIAASNQTWELRARALVQQVGACAGAQVAREGALFIATSCMEGDCVQRPEFDLDLHALAQRMAGWLDWRGPVFLVSSACTSSMQALLSARTLLQTGEFQHALVLGLELDNQLTVPGFAALQLLSPDRCRPFAADRNGLVLGEAVCALRLSTDAPRRWLLRGGANVVDGTSPTGASAQAVADMCRRAVDVSGLRLADVDLVKVQAAGSPINDAVEAEGLCAAFGEVPSLVSLKPLIGHCMGASGVAEIALLLECLEQGYVPAPTDPGDARLGVQLARQWPVPLRVVLACILGFGGSHAAVALEYCAV